MAFLSTVCRIGGVLALTPFPCTCRCVQVEYAMEAVKQGSACVGARSKTHAVMAALKRSTNDMSSYQKKIFKVDEHMVSPSGCKHRQLACMRLHTFTRVAPLSGIPQRMIKPLASQCHTQARVGGDARERRR